jgi:hypothetical protein
MRTPAIVAASLAVVVLACAAPGAVAADRPSLADDLAARLGISADRLREAFTATLAARIDAAVAAGKLTPEQGAKLKERIANAKGLRLGAWRGFAHRHHAHVARIAARANGSGPVATYLGMTREQLRAELRNGKSLAQIATEKGKTVAGLQAAILAPVKAALARAVANHRLAQQRADEILVRVTARVAKLVDRAPTTS